MTVYIIRERKKIKIYGVPAGQQRLFLAEKGRKILSSGHSLSEAINKLDVAEKLAVLRELSKK